MQMPDGITREHENGPKRANPLPLLILVILMGVGLFGIFGGQSAQVTNARNEVATLSVRTPEVLRNGMVFETTIEVEVARPTTDLTIAVSDTLWREMTINTMIPAPERESHKAGYHRFSFGAVNEGEVLRFKIDGQVNPPLFTGVEGEIAALDGDRRLATVPVRIRVLP